MNVLRLIFFAQFAAVALVVPPLTVPGRLIMPRLGRLIVIPLVALLPLVALVNIYLPGQSLTVVIWLQILVTAFTMAVAGLAVLAGRYRIWAGPLLVTLLTLAALTTPFWGDVLISVNHQGTSDLSSQWLVAGNPLFAVSAELDQFPWMHSRVIYAQYGGYKLTRIGEDFAFSATATWKLCAVYAGLGLFAAGVAGLVRPRGRPADYMVGLDTFC